MLPTPLHYDSANMIFQVQKNESLPYPQIQYQYQLLIRNHYHPLGRLFLVYTTTVTSPPQEEVQLDQCHSLWEEYQDDHLMDHG